MQVAGKENFESALREQLPDDVSDELVRLLVDKSETAMWRVHDAAVGFCGQVYVIPDEALRDFTLAANLATVAELGVGLGGASPAFAWTSFVNLIYKTYEVIRRTTKLSEQERQVMVALAMGPGSPESLQRRLEAAGAFVPASVVAATLDRFKELGLAQSGADRHWAISTELYNTPT